MKYVPFCCRIVSKIYDTPQKGAVFMKKSEKTMMCIFGCGIIAFAVNFIIKVFVMDTELDYHFFDGITFPLSIFFAISFLGALTLITRIWLRKRFEAGKRPVSKLYTATFLLSFLPFILLIIYSATEGEFTFLGSTVYGIEAFWENLWFYGILLWSAIVPVFPVAVFWQILYLVNRKKYRRLSSEK